MRDTRLNGRAVTPHGRYRVTTNLYLSLGGDGIASLAHGTRATTGTTDQAAPSRYLQAHPGLAPPPPTRVRPL